MSWVVVDEGLGLHVEACAYLFDARQAAADTADRARAAEITSQRQSEYDDW